jgi:DNA-binding GntR family transcriptional regulator
MDQQGTPAQQAANDHERGLPVNVPGLRNLTCASLAAQALALPAEAADCATRLPLDMREGHPKDVPAQPIASLYSQTFREMSLRGPGFSTTVEANLGTVLPQRWQPQASMNENTLDSGWRSGGRKPSLTEVAYERIEELFVKMRLRPGASVRMQDLQELVGLGRTPVHLAVRRLAAETLLEIRPRDGLTISTIDLARERRLARLRRDIDRFVVEEAARNETGNHRSRLTYLRRKVEEARSGLTVETFNRFDRTFDLLLIDATGERFLARTFRPLHAFARRIGFLHLTWLSGNAGLAETVDRHFDLLDAIVAGNVTKARKASDALVDFSISLIGGIAGNIDPTLLDASLADPERWVPPDPVPDDPDAAA